MPLHTTKTQIYDIGVTSTLTHTFVGQGRRHYVHTCHLSIVVY